MVENFGISGGGRTAEEEYRSLTGADPAPGAAIGDALLEGYPIEIKRATSNTLNQVRAVKYIPIAALFVPASQWYVIPAHVIVIEASRKKRGQHTENPFESATLNLGRLQHYRVEAGELRARTLAAIEESARYGLLKEAMERVLAQSRDLAQASVTDVRSLIEELQLTDLLVGRGAVVIENPSALERLFLAEE